MKTYIGIDNGVTGSIGIIDFQENYSFFQTPTINQFSYTKSKKKITRINFPKLVEILDQVKNNSKNNVFVLIERPMINPTRFNSSVSAIRSFEATQIALELLSIPFEVIDSKIWQKEILKKEIKENFELKKASVEIGCRLFPNCSSKIKEHGDADGLLIAEFARRKNL